MAKKKPERNVRDVKDEIRTKLEVLKEELVEDYAFVLGRDLRKEIGFLVEQVGINLARDYESDKRAERLRQIALNEGA